MKRSNFESKFLNLVSEPSTTQIEWSPLGRGGVHLVQEVKEEREVPVDPHLNDFWYGYRGDLKPKPQSNELVAITQFNEPVPTGT